MLKARSDPIHHSHLKGCLMRDDGTSSSDDTISEIEIDIDHHIKLMKLKENWTKQVNQRFSQIITYLSNIEDSLVTYQVEAKNVAIIIQVQYYWSLMLKELYQDDNPSLILVFDLMQEIDIEKVIARCLIGVLALIRQKCPIDNFINLFLINKINEHHHSFVFERLHHFCRDHKIRHFLFDLQRQMIESPINHIENDRDPINHIENDRNPINLSLIITSTFFRLFDDYPQMIHVDIHPLIRYFIEEDDKQRFDLLTKLRSFDRQLVNEWLLECGRYDW